MVVKMGTGDRQVGDRPKISCRPVGKFGTLVLRAQTNYYFNLHTFESLLNILPIESSGGDGFTPLLILDLYDKMTCFRYPLSNLCTSTLNNHLTIFSMRKLRFRLQY